MNSKARWNSFAFPRIGVSNYYSLTGGFLTGKYRADTGLALNRRARSVKKYFNAKDFAVVEALQEQAKRLHATAAQVALAKLKLNSEAVEALDAASKWLRTMMAKRPRRSFR